MLKRQATAAFLLPARLFSLLSPLECAVPRHRRFCTILDQISPLDSALTGSAPLSPLEYAVTETGGGGLVPGTKPGLFPYHGRRSPGTNDYATPNSHLADYPALPADARGCRRLAGRTVFPTPDPAGAL